MKKMFWTIIFIISLYFSAFSQKDLQCPKIKIIEPDSLTRSGEIMLFSVPENIKNDFEKAEFKWSVDKGKIIKGQGTSKIKVDTNDLDYIVINATLEISNLPVDCKNIFSGNGVVASNYDPVKNDQYGKLSLKDELLRLDNFLVELINISETQGYIVISYKDKEPLKKAESHVRKLLKHIKRRGFPAERITFLLDKSQFEDKTVLWIIPKDVIDLPFGTNEIIKISK